MKKVTPKDYQSFIQIYKGLPERSAVKAPKTEFVEEIAALCMCSTKTVRMWIHGVQKPDALKQKMISDKRAFQPIFYFLLQNESYRVLHNPGG